MREISHYAHKVTCDPQEPDTKPGPYYVSVTDGPQFAVLLGPFEKHKDALDRVEDVRAKAIELDPFAHFYSFGTVRMKPSYLKPGKLNAYFPLYGQQQV